MLARLQQVFAFLINNVYANFLYLNRSFVSLFFKDKNLFKITLKRVMHN